MAQNRRRQVRIWARRRMTKDKHDPGKRVDPAESSVAFLEVPVDSDRLRRYHPRPIARRLVRRANRIGGAIAQLGERLNGIQEVRGSTPLGSTRRQTQNCGSLRRCRGDKSHFLKYRSNFFLPSKVANILELSASSLSWDARPRNITPCPFCLLSRDDFLNLPIPPLDAACEHF